MNYFNPRVKQLGIILLLCCVLLSGCNATGENYNAAGGNYIDEIEGLTGRIESKQLRIILGDDSLVAGIDSDPLVVDVYAYAILSDLDQIEKTLRNIENILDDTSDLIAIMNKLSPPDKFQEYHIYYLNVLGKYKDALEDKHNFYSETKYEASSLTEPMSEGNLLAWDKSDELESENQQYNNRISSALRELISATNEFKALIGM